MKFGRIGEIMYQKSPPSLERTMFEILEFQNCQYRCGMNNSIQANTTE